MIAGQAQNSPQVRGPHRSEEDEIETCHSGKREGPRAMWTLAKAAESARSKPVKGVGLAAPRFRKVSRCGCKGMITKGHPVIQVVAIDLTACRGVIRRWSRSAAPKVEEGEIPATAQVVDPAVKQPWPRPSWSVDRRTLRRGPMLIRA